MSLVLYKWAEGHGLPSLSPACIQVEAYLRLAGVPFQVQICTSPSNSPTASLPAVEVDAEVAGSSQPAEGEYQVASYIISYLAAKSGRLDVHLTGSQQADVTAFRALLRSTFDAACSLSMWKEGQGFSEFRKAAYAATLPVPLNWVVPWALRRDMLAKMGQMDAAQVYEASCAALEAVASKLRSSVGPFFFGDAPSSLDALLYGHLLFFVSSPMAAPTLRTKAQSFPEICDFVHHINQRYFEGRAAPLLNPDTQATSWSDSAQGKKKSKKPPPTESELEQWRRSQLWLLGVGAAMASYVLLGGRYVRFIQQAQLGDMGEDEEDEEDEEDQD